MGSRLGNNFICILWNDLFIGLWKDFIIVIADKMIIYVPEVVMLAFFFLIIMTPVTSQAYILVFIFQNLNLPTIAPFAFFFRYLFFACGALLAPAFTLTLKQQLLFSAGAFIINFLCGTLIDIHQPTIVAVLMCMGCAVGGFGLGMIWVSSSRYLHLVCEMKNIVEERGAVLGMFQFITCFAFVGGALLTFLEIGVLDINVNLYFATLAMFGFAAYFFNSYKIL